MKKLKGLFSLLVIGFGLLINHTFSNFTYSGVYYQDGFYYNEEKGLITFIIGDEVSTRQDKNLGATTGYNGTISSFGTISCENYGNFYQFGNNFGFPCESVVSGVYNDLSVELTGNHTYENPINLNVPYSNSSNYDISDSWGGFSVVSPSTLQGPCPDGFFLPTRDMISDLLGDFQTFGFGDGSNRINYPAILYYTKFIPQSRYFGLPFSLSNNSSVISRVNFRFSDNFNYNSNLVSIMVADGKIRYYNQYAGGNIGVPLSINGQYFMSVRCFRNTALLPSNTWVALTGGDTSILPPPEVDEGGDQFTGNVNSNSLYYNCLGPTYNTPDGLPPKYCFNSSGEFQGDFLKNCYLSFDGLNQYVYCYNDGFQQEVEFVENGSGYDIVACDGCSTNILDWLNDGYSAGYFENFLYTTGYFFKCPFPYSESLTVWPKLISMMNGFDINLPINCAFAGYSQGKQVISFEHSGHLIQGGPILNFEGDNRNLLYRFFDFLIILGLLFFFGKILKFFS